MSKIGRVGIPLAGVSAEVRDNLVTIKGAKAEVVHALPLELVATVTDGVLYLSLRDGVDKKSHNAVWGLNRALLANKIKGLGEGFKSVLKIVGLGFKVQQQGSKLVFSLGYSHKIDYELPEGVSINIDKSGQTLTLTSQDKFILGDACATIRSFRPPEPYKGTGIMFEGERIIRKAGKAKV